MRYRDLDEMFSVLKQKPRQRIPRFAVVAAEDSHTLEAALRIFEEGVATPILIGDQTEIEHQLRAMGKDNCGVEIISVTEGMEACAQTAVDLVNAGHADFIQKGLIDTNILLKTVMKKENGLLTGGLLSVAGFLEVPAYHKLLCITDGALNIEPNLEQKKGILRNAVKFMNDVGIDEPKVAVLCAVEKVNPKMPETVDAAALKEMNFSGEITGCIVEGPISYDIAVDKEAAELKGFNSEVAGDADILLVPNLLVGNIASKALLYSGGARTAAALLGLKVPLVLTSRSTPAEEKYMSVLLAALSCS